MQGPRGKRAIHDDANEARELRELIKAQKLDQRGRTLSMPTPAAPPSQPGAGEDAGDLDADGPELEVEAAFGTLDKDTREDLGFAKVPDAVGTGRAGRRELMRARFRRHATRLTIIDPIAASLAAIRLLQLQPPTIAQISELVGRSTSTIESDLQSAFARMLLLDRYQPPEPEGTYETARAAGLSQGAAGFAFWFAYTLSAERASELSGCGRGGAITARNSVMRQLQRAGANDSRVHAWFVALDTMIGALKKLRAVVVAGTGTKLASTTLGKRRTGLHAGPLGGNSPAPIAWLDASDADVRDAASVGDDFEAIERIALERYMRLDGDPVALLADALENDPVNVITLALELAGRDLPYYDAFKDG